MNKRSRFFLSLGIALMTALTLHFTVGDKFRDELGRPLYHGCNGYLNAERHRSQYPVQRIQPITKKVRSL
ncbi:hypothetical protein DYBT9275_03255 [Dyadobacter sp. CECT 9275]|uniref:Uncharacterized protein n=1 Tax=Dyadobacter helix TaxID=2822344 RepID=A0A916JFS9_9BACT|nr:hypothetical protein [Dyadobacter sp. CECT 9275]CAG5003906.1 hypothetical protein DYBT9275_03255 [Dyadobacter sp. CECT 9275]